jgi:hypothetical protein
LLEPSPGPAATLEARRRDSVWFELVTDPIGLQRYVADEAASLEQQLANNLAQATRAVHSQVRSLGRAVVENLVEQLSQILSVDAWDDDDDLLNITSLKTMIHVVSRLGSVGDLTITRNGNLVSTWSRESHVLRVEAHPDGTVSWTILHPRGNQPRHERTPHGSIDDVVGAATGLGQPDGPPGGQ